MTNKIAPHAMATPPPDDITAFIAGVLSHLRRWTKLAGVRTSDAEDLLQDALVRLLEHEDDIQPQSRASWLRTALLHERLHFWSEEAVRRKHAAPLAAHLLEQGSQLPSPDAQSARRELFEAVGCLLEYVAPRRRAVAGWCIWRILVDDEVGLEVLAQELEIERGTLGSQWDRAKEDMREGLRRERAKRRGRSKAAALFMSFTVVWLWLLARGRSAAAAVGAPSGRRRVAWCPRGASVPTIAIAAGRRGKGSSPWTDRAVAGALLACALLPFALTTHAIAEDAGAAEAHPSDGAAIAETAGAVDTHSNEQAAIAEQAGAAETPPNEQAAIAEAAPAFGRPVSDSGPRDSDPPAVTPSGLADGRDAQGTAGDALTTLSRSAGVPAGRSASLAAPGGSARSAGALPSSSAPAKRRSWLAPRTSLVSAYRALWQEHDRAKARRILELYEASFPHDPMPDQHAELAAALRALDARDAGGVGIEK